MRFRFSWGFGGRDENGNIAKYDQKWLYLDAIVTAASEEEGSNTLANLETAIKKSHPSAELLRCPTWMDGKYYDSISFLRDIGNIKEQKMEIMEAVCEAKNTIV